MVKYCLICGKRLNSKKKGQQSRKYCKSHTQEEINNYWNRYYYNKALKKSHSLLRELDRNNPFNSPCFEIKKLNQRYVKLVQALGSKKGHICLNKYEDYLKYNIPLDKYDKEQIDYLNTLDWQTYNEKYTKHLPKKQYNSIKPELYTPTLEIVDGHLFFVDNEFKTFIDIHNQYNTENTNYSLMPTS